MTAERRRRFGVARQLVGWIAAYAFVLQAVFAAMVATQLAAGQAAPGFELCLTHAEGGAVPAQGQHQHEQCALHCAADAGFAVLALALIALLFPLRPVGYAPVRRRDRAPDLFCRAGLSRAPPHAA